jgi:hypothetical protein
LLAAQNKAYWPANGSGRIFRFISFEVKLLKETSLFLDTVIGWVSAFFRIKWSVLETCGISVVPDFGMWQVTQFLSFQLYFLCGSTSVFGSWQPWHLVS